MLLAHIKHVLLAQCNGKSRVRSAESYHLPVNLKTAKSLSCSGLSETCYVNTQLASSSCDVITTYGREKRWMACGQICRTICWGCDAPYLGLQFQVCEVRVLTILEGQVSFLEKAHFLEKLTKQSTE